MTTRITLLGVVLWMIFLLPFSLYAAPDSSTTEQNKNSGWYYPPYRGYGALSLRMQQFNNRMYANYGYSGAFLISEHFAIGGGGVASFAQTQYQDNNNPRVHNRQLSFGYGGCMPEVRFFSGDGVGFFANTLLGAGGFSFDNDSKNSGGAFLLVEPCAGLSVALHQHLRIEAGASYRYCFGASSDILALANFNRPTAFMQLRFGIF